MTLAPIILFVYNRPSHTLQTLEALALNELANESVLYIFADGIKKNADSITIQKINETREIIKSKKWCKEVVIIEREQNFGLAKSVIKGVTEIINKYEKVIVLEDDLITSPYFLKFMNESLHKYEKEDRVACISAYIYPINDLPELFFIKGADCWGWATWKRCWDVFEVDGKKLLKELEINSLLSDFDFNNAYPYTQMLRDQVNKKNDSWAIRWYASCYLKNKLCLYPGNTFVENIGLDGSGVHSGVNTNFNSIVTLKPATMHTILIKEDTDAKKRIQHYFESIKEVPAAPKSFLSRVYKKLLPESIRKKMYAIRHPSEKLTHGWFGNYKSWEASEAECSGYDSDVILQKVKEAILKVKSGEAKYERDSVLFDEMQHSEDLLKIFNICIENKQLHITDFGGSLGSSYFQHKSLLLPETNLKWSVVEQPHFVECGKKEIAENDLFFFSTIDEVLTYQNNHVLLLSSVLSYFKEPYKLIESLLTYRFKYIIIDRNAFIEHDQERITKQIVPSFIYDASYPAWFFNEEKFVKAFSKDYDLVSVFDSAVDPVQNLEDGVKSYRKGFYFKLKNI